MASPLGSAINITPWLPTDLTRNQLALAQPAPFSMGGLREDVDASEGTADASELVWVQRIRGEAEVAGPEGARAARATDRGSALPVPQSEGARAARATGRRSGLGGGAVSLSPMLAPF